MPWNTNLPADTTKIRDLGVVIRANNTAIAGGDVSLAPPRWNISNSGGVPPAQASMVRFYGNNDSAGNAQIFAIDPTSNISRITSTPIQSALGAAVVCSGSGGNVTFNYNNTYKIHTQGHFTVGGVSYPAFEIVGRLVVVSTAATGANQVTMPWPFPFLAGYPLSIQLTGLHPGNVVPHLVSFTNTDFVVFFPAQTSTAGCQLHLRILGV